MLKVITYWPKLIREIYQTVKYYKAVKSVQPELEKENIRIDWIGRIYTVIPLKDEFIQQPEMVQQSYVFQQLKPIGDLLLKYGLSNQAFPEIRKVSPNTFLVVLYPENEYLTLYDIFKNLLHTGILITILYLLYSYVFPLLMELVKPYLNV